MDKHLRPDKLCTDPNSSNAATEWLHWKCTFENFIAGMDNIDDKGKLTLLINYVTPAVFTLFNDCDKYSDAIEKLKLAFVKPKNEVFSRHKLATRNQASHETVSQYFTVLQQLSQECEFKSVTAQENKEAHMLDAFIRGLNSQETRLRLLENHTLTLKQAYEQALALEMAKSHSDAYSNSDRYLNALPTSNKNVSHSILDTRCSPSTETLATTVIQKCFFCGRLRHPRNKCPAKDAVCNSCNKLGHFSVVCRSKTNLKKTVASSAHNEPQPMQNAQLDEGKVVSVIAPSSLSKSLIDLNINGKTVKALADSGSSSSYIDEQLARDLNLTFVSETNKDNQVSMASKSLSCEIKYICYVDLKLKDEFYKDFPASILPNACVDFIIGHDLLDNYEKVVLHFKGSKPPLEICSLAVANVSEVSLFENLTPDCRPIATKSRRFSLPDSQFIDMEIKRLLKEEIIVESRSPWRAQVVVVANEKHKRRMCIDYSQTINKFTQLDAYPLPLIEEIVNKVSQNTVFSTIDLSSAYHQVPIKEKDRPYTAFEANGKLYEFCRIPFGVTNGVPCFQRFIDNIIKTEELQGTYAYLDDVTVCGKNQEEHDINFQRFMKTVEKYNLTINKEKSKFSKSSINLLGNTISNHTIRPDPNRLQPLLEFPVPNNLASLRRAMGMFAHYAKYIPNFSNELRPLVDCKQFPLNKTAIDAFEKIKTMIAKAAVHSIDESASFEVETDASDQAIGATLSQSGRPVAFFSRTLSQTERHHSAVEREAYAIVESLKKWKHFLLGKHFKLITDQQSVSFMLNQKHSSRIKNEKILRWRLELSNYHFDIVYRPGKDNAAADALSRICASLSESSNTSLSQLHVRLCHPGVTRMYHWVRSRNLPFSINEIREVTKNCKVCCEIKPNFFKAEGKLIKATAPFERLNLDFKGPMPSSSRNRYILTIIDEYSRFPFAIPCPDVSAETVTENLKRLFYIFGTPSYVHSDRGSAFMSAELKQFLTLNNVASSHTTAYNPQGNGQTERYNGIIWKTIMLALKSKGLEVSRWEAVIGEALHAIRSLLCTSTNETPHERMFKHHRRGSCGSSVPSWLSAPGTVLMRKHTNLSKYDPLVQEVSLLEVNPNYAYVRLPNGTETTVSLRHLAPQGTDDGTAALEHKCLPSHGSKALNSNEYTPHSPETSFSSLEPSTSDSLISNKSPSPCHTSNNDEPVQPLPSFPEDIQRPRRSIKPPGYLKDYV